MDRRLILAVVLLPALLADPGVLSTGVEAAVECYPHQLPRGYRPPMTFTTGRIAVPAAGGTGRIDIIGGCEFTLRPYTGGAFPGWVTLSKTTGYGGDAGDSVTVTVAPNAGDARGLTFVAEWPYAGQYRTTVLAVVQTRGNGTPPKTYGDFFDDGRADVADYDPDYILAGKGCTSAGS